VSYCDPTLKVLSDPGEASFPRGLSRPKKSRIRGEFQEDKIVPYQRKKGILSNFCTVDNIATRVR